MTDPTPRLRAVLLLQLALLGGLLAVPVRAQERSIPFHTIAVLPAINETGDKKLWPWQLGWQHLVQERIRELPGLRVARLQEAPELLEQLRTGKLDPARIETRTQLASTLGADRLIVLKLQQGPPDWQVVAEIHDPAAGPMPLITLPPASGQLPTVLVDSIVTAALKDILGVPTVELEPWAREEVPAAVVEQFVRAFQLWPYLAAADAERGELAKALPVLDRLVQRPSPLWLAHQQHAYATIASGKADQALVPLQRWATANRNSARSSLLLGQVLAATGDDVKAVDQLVQAANKTKGSVAAVEALAGSYRRMGRVDEAIKQYTAAAELWPRVLPFHLKAGQLALDAGQPEAALTAFRQATTLAPTNLDAHLGLTRALLARRQYVEALAVALRGVELAPDSAAAQRLVAEAALGAEDFAMAQEAAQAAVTLAADDAVAHRLLGEAALAQGDVEVAEPVLVKAIELDAKGVDAYRMLSETRLFADNLAGAAEALQAGLKVASPNERPRVQLDLGWVQLYRQQYEPAAKTAAAVEALLPADPEPLYLKGTALLYQQQLAPAVDAVRAALDRDPGAAGFGQRVIADLEHVGTGGGIAGLDLVLGLMYESAGRARDAASMYRSFVRSSSDEALVALARERLAAVGG